MTKPSQPPDGFIVEPLYRCRWSVARTSFLAGSVCWRLRHLYAHRMLVSRRWHSTWGMFTHRQVWCRGRRSVSCVLLIFLRSGDSDAMKKGITSLPCDPYIWGAEISSIFYEVWPDNWMWSSCLHMKLLGLSAFQWPALAVAISPRKLRPGPKTDDVEHRMWP